MPKYQYALDLVTRLIVEERKTIDETFDELIRLNGGRQLGLSRMSLRRFIDNNQLIEHYDYDESLVRKLFVEQKKTLKKTYEELERLNGGAQLGLSLESLRKFIRDNHIKKRCQLSEGQLRYCVKHVTNTRGERAGCRITKGVLVEKLKVGQISKDRVMKVLHLEDPQGVVKRTKKFKKDIIKRSYHANYPMQNAHVDQVRLLLGTILQIR